MTSSPRKSWHHFASMVALISCVAVAGCAFSSAQSPIDNSTFQGRYIFKSQGFNISTSPSGPFFEAGVCIADGQGHYTVYSTQNASGQIVLNNTLQIDGTYSLNSQGVGTMQTSLDTANFYISADGNHAYVVSTDPGSTWLVELTRE